MARGIPGSDFWFFPCLMIRNRQWSARPLRPGAAGQRRNTPDRVKVISVGRPAVRTSRVKAAGALESNGLSARPQDMLVEVEVDVDLHTK